MRNLITFKKHYIDRIKIGVNANQYTFVWRRKLNYPLVDLLDMIDAFHAKYNTCLRKNENSSM